MKQEAALALLDATRRFDPAYGTKLLTYATPMIEATMMDYAAQYSSPLSIPASRYNQLCRGAYTSAPRARTHPMLRLSRQCAEN